MYLKRLEHVCAANCFILESNLSLEGHQFISLVCTAAASLFSRKNSRNAALTSVFLRNLTNLLPKPSSEMDRISDPLMPKKNECGCVSYSILSCQAISDALCCYACTLPEDSLQILEWHCNLIHCQLRNDASFPVPVNQNTHK